MDQKNETGKVVTGKAVGGKARWEGFTAEQKSAHSKKALAAKAAKALLPTTKYTGTIKIGDIEIPCANLDDGRRLISERAITRAFGAKRGGSHWKRLKKHEAEGGELTNLVVLSAGNIAPFVSQEVRDGLSQRTLYRTPTGVSKDYGIDAALLPKICNTLLKVRDANSAHPSQFAIIVQADIIMRGLAEVGIAGLIDEATGYQAARDRDGLAKLLQAYVAKELQPWVCTFPPKFFENLFRLYKLPYPPQNSPNFKPGFFGHIINDAVYSRLVPGLLPELKKAASKTERSARLHQFLTDDIGHPKLKAHIEKLMLLQDISDDAEQFKAHYKRGFPVFGEAKTLDLASSS